MAKRIRLIPFRRMLIRGRTRWDWKRLELEQTKMKEQIILEDDKNGFNSLGKINVEKELACIGAVDISFCMLNDWWDASIWSCLFYMRTMTAIRVLLNPLFLDVLYLEKSLFIFHFLRGWRKIGPIFFLELLWLIEMVFFIPIWTPSTSGPRYLAFVFVVWF